MHNTFDIFVLCATLLGSLIFKKVLSPRARNYMVPLALSYYLLVIVVIGSVGTAGLAHFLFTSMNFVPVMIMCDGLNSEEWRGNGVWKAFLVFYVYMTLIGLTGFLPVSCTTFYLQSFLNTFASGYFVARWVCRTEGGLKKLLIPLTVVGCIAVFNYVRNQGFLTSDLDQAGRIDVSEFNDDENFINVNGVALRISAIVPFLLLAFRFISRPIIFKYFALASMVILGLLLIRTGSRNGALVLIPLGWYYLHSGRRGGVQLKYMISLFVLGVVFAVGVLVTNKGVDTVRAFDFKGRSQTDYYSSVMDTMTTGRWSMYMHNLEQFSSLEIVFGKGGLNSHYTSRGVRIVRFRGANAHSIYMTIFYRTGIVGVMLFVIFLFAFWMQAKRLGARGNMAKFLLLVWLLTGLGESWGMNGGATAILAGFAIGLLSRKPATNSEFGEFAPPYDYYWNMRA